MSTKAEKHKSMSKNEVLIEESYLNYLDHKLKAHLLVC